MEVPERIQSYGECDTEQPMQMHFSNEDKQIDDKPAYPWGWVASLLCFALTSTLNVYRSH